MTIVAPKQMKFAALIFFSLLALAIANIANAQVNTKQEPAKKDTASAKEAQKEAKAKAGKYMAANKPDAAKAVVLPKDVKKLIVEDMIPGNGKTASKGKTVKVHYTGWLYDPSKAMGRGKQFDTSVGKEAFSFQLGTGKVIKGWDDGFENMKVGGKRKLIIPSEMGYGEGGAGADIPPNASLMFEVELLDVN